MQKSASLRDTLHNHLLELSTKDGINASGKEDIYGCIFGRDSAITILKILQIHNKQKADDLLAIAKRGLITLTELQGREFNIESGEEPGKFIHEYRPNKYERLVNRPKPWYVYNDGILRNYDSIDATPLALIALYKYYESTHDGEFLLKILPSVEKGLNWLISFGDIDKDFFIEYELSPNRKSGGLVVQSWTDSRECILAKNGSMPPYPIAPVEAQGYTWLALKLWANFYQTTSPTFAQKLSAQARELKKKLNESFILKDKGFYFAAQALNGNKKQIKTITANPLLLLWAAYKKGNRFESILDECYVDDFVKRAFLPDMFVKNAGIRTMSSESEIFNPAEDSYHNGSFWPMLNGLITEGLTNFGYYKEAALLTESSLAAIDHFKTPIELYILEANEYKQFKSKRGQTSCMVQAWSAAAALDWLTPNSEITQLL